MQESASRTTIGATHPQGFVLFFTKAIGQMNGPKCKNPLSIHSLAVIFFFLHFSKDSCEFLSTPQPSSRTLTTFSSWLWKQKHVLPRVQYSRSADISLTSLCLFEKEVHFASQEVDVDLKEICCRGGSPCSTDIGCICRRNIFLKEDKKKQNIIFEGPLQCVCVCVLGVQLTKLQYFQYRW